MSADSKGSSGGANGSLLWRRGARPRPGPAADTLVIGISSRVLFNLDQAHDVYERHGVEAYREYQVENENVVLEKGSAFALVEKLLRINERCRPGLVDVVLLSRNSADTGLRVFNSIEEYGLPVSRAAFCNGHSPMRYAGAFGVNLFLSSNVADVRTALEQGYAAALCLPRNPASQVRDSKLIRFAFDGDGVLFSDQAERVHQSEGLERFVESERAAAGSPLPGGPFKPFLAALHRLQHEAGEQCPIRTILITARSAPAHKRVITTFRAWRINIDEALFLGGVNKAEFIRAFAADAFFDDQRRYCEPGVEETMTGHVPFGVMNEEGGDVTA